MFSFIDVTPVSVANIDWFCRMMVKTMTISAIVMSIANINSGSEKPAWAGFRDVER